MTKTDLTQAAALALATERDCLARPASWQGEAKAYVRNARNETWTLLDYSPSDGALCFAGSTNVRPEETAAEELWEVVPRYVLSAEAEQLQARTRRARP